MIIANKELIIKPTASDPLNDVEPPTCKADCPYRQEFRGYDLQRNALRTETVSIVSKYRCGWNIKPGRIGGHPLDYEACIYSKNF